MKCKLGNAISRRMRSERGIGLEVAIILALVIFAIVGLILTLAVVNSARTARQQKRIADRMELERIFEEYRSDPNGFRTDTHGDYHVVISSPDSKGRFYFLVFSKGETVLKAGLRRSDGADVTDRTSFQVFSWEPVGSELDRIGESFFVAVQEDTAQNFEERFAGELQVADENSLLYGAELNCYNKSLSEYVLLIRKGQRNLLTVTVKFEKQLTGERNCTVTEWVYGEMD